MKQKLNIPIYLVSLEQDVARREKLKERFPETYSSFQHVKAVDGRVLPAKEYFDKTQGFYQKYKRIMLPAELGCTLSHIKALETFLASGEEFGLILEDDIIGNDEDIYRISSVSACLDENTLLLCGGQEGLNKRYQLFKQTKQRLIHEVAQFSYQFVYRTCCYLVTKKSAQEILHYHLKKHITLADKWDVFFIKSNAKILYTDTLQHPDDLADSHIEADRTLNKKTFFRKLFAKDSLYKVLRRLYWEVKSFSLILAGYKRFN